MSRVNFGAKPLMYPQPVLIIGIYDENGVPNDFYDGWMKNPKSAMISCNDGFRPVSFLLETMEEDAE